MIRATALLPIGFTLALAASAPAAAQQRHDSNAPIDFDAQHIELQDKANRVILSGGVRIKQAEMMHACQGCGKPFHNACAGRLDACPQCGTPT